MPRPGKAGKEVYGGNMHNVLRSVSGMNPPRPNRLEGNDLGTIEKVVPSCIALRAVYSVLRTVSRARGVGVI